MRKSEREKKKGHTHIHFVAAWLTYQSIGEGSNEGAMQGGRGPRLGLRLRVIRLQEKASLPQPRESTEHVVIRAFILRP